MNMPDGTIVVTDIAGRQAAAEVGNSPEVRAWLESFGFHQEKGQFVRPIASEEDRIALVQILLERGALFSFAPGWSPSELVTYYRDLHKVSGSFFEITWHSPEDYVIREHR